MKPCGRLIPLWVNEPIPRRSWWERLRWLRTAAYVVGLAVGVLVLLGIGLLVGTLSATVATWAAS